MQDHLEQMLQELAHYAAGGDVHPHVEQMAREIEHFAKHRPDTASHDDMLAHIMLHKANGGSVRHEPTEIGVDEAPNMMVKRYMPPSMQSEGMPVGGIDLNPGQPGQQFAPPPQQGQQPPQGMPPQGQPPQGMPPAGPQAPDGPPSNILNMTRQGQAMSAMKAPQAAPPNPSPLIKNGMARMAEGGSIKPIVRGIIKEQVTDLAAMKRALMKAKR